MLFQPVLMPHFLKTTGLTLKSLSAFLTRSFFLISKMFEKAKGYPDEQMSLIIMDTFKGQDNDEVAKLCRKNNCALIIVPHNLTNKFQPLDITVNKPAKSFIKDKYNMWYTEQVAKQLNEGKAPADVEVSLNLSEIKPLHAKWIYEMYEYLRGRSDLVLNGFESAGITEAVEKSNEDFERIENSFLASKNNKN